MKQLIAGVLAGSLIGVPSVTAQIDTPAKQPPTRAAQAHLVVKPGETVRWQSPKVGPITRLALRIGGRPAAYATEPKTNACVAYGYQAGVAVRLTDCVKGRRVRYVRVRAVSAALEPVAIRLRLN